MKELIPKEEDEQRALAELLDRIKYKGRLLRWCHYPAEGKRKVQYAVKMKRLGLKSGIPDVIIFDHPPNFPRCKGAVIELKRRKKWKLSEEQGDWLIYFEENGWKQAICPGLDDAIQELRNWGYIK